MIWDEIVIGAGIAGLYWIYKTKPINYLLLEKSDRIGGRIYNMDWNGNQISLGGGIIKDDNYHTIRLSKELGFELGEGISKYEMIDWDKSVSSTPNEDDFYSLNKNIIKYLKKIFNQNKQEIKKTILNFEEFLDLYVDLELVQMIKSNLLYKTYYKADIESVLYDEIYELLRIKDFKLKFIKDGGYTKLLNKLIEFVGIPNIKTNQNVMVISKQSNSQIYQIKTDSDKTYEAKKIIIATESGNGIKFNNLEIADKISDVYSMCSGSNYIRVYSYHKYGHGLKFSYKTSGLAGKVILINNNILMCCYTEELDAIKLNNMLSNKSKSEQAEIIFKLLNKCKIPITKPDDLIIKFWNIGVHYNTPKYNKEKKKMMIKDLVKENIVIIGECVSDSHGWVDSALESVNFILD